MGAATSSGLKSTHDMERLMVTRDHYTCSRVNFFAVVRVNGHEVH